MQDIKLSFKKTLVALIDFEDNQYVAGAKIVATAKDVYSKADMILKVKEPQKNLNATLSVKTKLSSYLHLLLSQH